MHDLFPETLLVDRKGGHVFTTSRKVAEHFGKRHADVLRSIERLLTELAEVDAAADQERNFAFLMTADHERIFASAMSDHELNFELVMYESNHGKGAIRRQPEYHLSHDGFALLAMGFTGREALRWKVAFLQAFRRMEAELAAVQARYVTALDVIRPNLRPVVQDFEQGLTRSDTAMWLGKSPGSVTYHRRQARRLGLLPAAKGRA